MVNKSIKSGKYVMYDVLDNTATVVEIDSVKNEMLERLEIMIEVLVSDLKAIIRDMISSTLTIKDYEYISGKLDDIEELAESIRKLALLNEFDELVNAYPLGKYVIENVDDLEDDVKEKIDVSKCKSIVWIGFEKTDEYGTYICEMSE